MNNTYNIHGYYFLLSCLAISLVILYFILQPFLAPLILAGVFSFIFQSFYKKFLKLTGGHAGFSAFIVTIIAIIIVVLPVALLGTLILKEATGLYQTFAGGDKSGFISAFESVTKWIHNILPISADYDLDISQYAKQGLESIVSNLGSIFSSFAKIFLNAFVFLIAFYFFLKDGGKFKDYLVVLSPLHDSDDGMIVSRLESAVSATVKGNLTIGFIQGGLTGIGFALFGVPNPVLWGSVASITALVPGIGTALVIAPAVIFLFVSGNIYSGVGLIVWGVIAVGLIDNFLGPRLVGRGMRIHPLAVFLSVLGGLAFFGPLGFILGPLTVSVCFALIDIYSSLRKRGHE